MVTLPAAAESVAVDVEAAQPRWRLPHATGLMLALTVALGFTILMSVAITLEVRGYYLTHLPHFDSVGTYTIAFRINNTVASSGFTAGLIEATAVSLTWLQ